MGGEAFDDALIEGADHHDVAHARDDLPGVFHRLAAPQLRVTRVEVDRRAAQLLHSGFKRQPRAGAGFLENHHQRAVSQRPVLLVGLEFLFDDAGAFKQILEFFAGEIIELQKMFDICCHDAFPVRVAKNLLSADTGYPAFAVLRPLT